MAFPAAVLAVLSLSLAMGSVAQEAQLRSNFAEKLHGLRVLQADGHAEFGSEGLQDKLLQRGSARSVRMVGGAAETSGSYDGDFTSVQGEPDSSGGGSADWNPSTDSSQDSNSFQANEVPNNVQDEAPVQPSAATLSWLKESFLAVTERVVSANPVVAGPPEGSTAQPDSGQVGDSYYSNAFRASQGVQTFDDSDSDFVAPPRTPLGLFGVGSISPDPPPVTSFG